MGAFASMAQNAYGLKICGIACLGFALTFLHEFFYSPSKEGQEKVSLWMRSIELLSLTVIALIFLFKSFSITFLYSDLILTISLAVLFLLFSYQTIIQLKIALSYQAMLVYVMACYYGAVLFFVLSLLSGILLPIAATSLAVVAVLLVVVYVGLTLIFKEYRVSDEAVSIWQYTRQMKNKSAIVLISCLLISGYSLLYSTGVLPSFYYDTPKGYQELVKMSNTLTNVDDKEKPREFKERYEDFVRKHGTN
jgi:hypothetical protein